MLNVRRVNNMSILAIIKGTPIWVWILFAFLIKRGINALYDREMRIQRLFFMPVLFLIWAVYSVLNETTFPNSAFLALIVGIIVGGGIGWGLWRSQPRLKKGSENGLIIRSGTPLTLSLILTVFIVKFIISAMMNINSNLLYSFNFNLLFGFICGLSDGVFWGGTLNLFIHYNRAC
ncbi:membrane protein [Xenorhabdus eapokensis]|uniref:Membrane protein n=2 Tax=Xenorhabdus eapokensis TaxID=1873482 RepID=A0A1Q5TCK3_9GAMM|nr:membrane protein [Xenorhabdus eapokensis]